MVNYAFLTPFSELSKNLKKTGRKLFGRKTILFFGIVIIILMFGSFSYYYIHAEERINTLSKSTTESSRQLKNLKNEFASLRLKQESNQTLIKKFSTDIDQVVEDRLVQDKQVLAASDTGSLVQSVPAGVIRVNDNYTDPVAIYDSPLAVNQIATTSSGTVFLFFKKEMGYYQIELTKDAYKVGWIQAQNVTEMP